MLKLTKEGNASLFDWVILDKEADGDIKSETAYFFHISDFNKLATSTKPATAGIWLDSDDSLDQAPSDIQSVPAIAINFPAFADGRGFSLAQELRMEKQYKGDIYAIGQFMEEQLFYLKRCGFDAFVIDDDADIETLKSILTDFSNNYQGSPTERKPLFKRRA